MRSLPVIICSVALIASGFAARAETVSVKGRGNVDLTIYSCTDVKNAKLVKRICYDAAGDVMIVQVSKNYEQFCKVDDGDVHKFLDAGDADRYYNRTIKGHFSCKGKDKGAT